MTRREVLQTAAVAAGGVAAGAERPLAAEPNWFDKPMRWAQLNSTEDDAAEMDIPFWLEYFKRIHADALFEEWTLEGIRGKTAVFLAEKIARLDDPALQRFLKEKAGMDVGSSVTIVRRGGYAFVNFGFEAT